MAGGPETSSTWSPVPHLDLHECSPSMPPGGRVFGFRIDECPKCHGTWFDRGELRLVTNDRAIEALIKDYATTAPNPIQCVRDRTPMRKRTIADVEIDVCQKCGGFWVDGGELEELEEAVQAVEAPPKEGVPLVAALTPRDVALLAWIAPDTLSRLQHETHPR